MVTGVAGQLGYEVVSELLLKNFEVYGTDIREPADMAFYVPGKAKFIQLDITDENEVMTAVTGIAPDAVIHCAAWTAVDLAEDEENRDMVFAVNSLAAQYIANACQANGAKMIYISTDYVFDGQGDTPWQPDCKDYAPLNVYGQSKLDGELAVSRTLDQYFIVRIAWAFGKNGNNFVRTMLNLSEKYETLRVVNDQIGTPTYMPHLARLLVQMVQTDKYGYYHATNEGGYISWYDFACEIFRQANRKTTVMPVSTEEYGVSKAKRPANSRLDKSKLKKHGFDLLPDWKEALGEYLREVGY